MRVRASIFIKYKSKVLRNSAHASCIYLKQRDCAVEVAVMCRANIRTVVGTCAICFGAGILLSFLLPGFFLAFIEAAVVIAAGVLLLGKKSR